MDVLFEATELNTSFLVMELVIDILDVDTDENVLYDEVEETISVLNIALDVKWLSFGDEVRTAGVVDVFVTASVIQEPKNDMTI